MLPRWLLTTAFYEMGADEGGAEKCGGNGVGALAVGAVAVIHGRAARNCRNCRSIPMHQPCRLGYLIRLQRASLRITICVRSPSNPMPVTTIRSRVMEAILTLRIPYSRA